jgi:murein DD-endopeptidase MepM/ murein hydrolase activator NlpD
MARIYESTPGQIRLTGPQQGVGFNPVQAFDPSAQFTREADRRISQANAVAETILTNNKVDLENLVGFSETLNKAMIEETKGRIESDIKLGIARVLNGDVTVNPDIIQKYKTEKQQFETAAQQEIQTADQLTFVNPGLGETYRQENPTLNAYQRYGEAIGKAQLAASQAESVLDTFVRDRDTQIPLTQPDGSVRMITPATAQTQPELMAVWQVGLQRFMEAAGLRDLNPLIIAEHLTPTMLRVRGKVLGERMQEIVQNRKGLEQERFIANVGSKVSGFADPTLAQNLTATTYKDAYNLTGNWQAANKLANDTIIAQIQRLGSTNPAEAKTALDNYEASLINPDDPSLRTVGERFGLEIAEVRARLDGTIQAQAQEVKESAKEEIDSMINQFQASPSPALYSSTEKKLEEMQTLYPEATEALVKLRTFGKNYNPKNDQNVIDAIGKGIITSVSDLKLLEATGHISSDAAQKARALLPSDDNEKTLPDVSVMRSFARNHLRNILRQQGEDSSKFADRVASTVSSVVDIAAATTLREMQTKELNRLQAQTFMEQQIVAALGPGGDFSPRQDKNGNWILPTPGSLRGMPPVVRRVSGPSGLDLANQVAARLPRVVSGRNSILFPRERIELNLDVLNNGGKPSADLEVMAKASNLSVNELLKQQAALQGIPFNVTPQNVSAKRYSDNYSYDPAAAAALANPRITGRARERYRLRLQRAKAGETFQSQLQGGAGKALTSLRTALGDLEGGPGDEGYGGYNNGVAGNLRDPQLPKMTIAQVKQRGYLHNGKYQFKVKTLEAAQRLAGIPDTAKFDKATQDQLFDAVITEGFPWRKRLNAYLRGQSNDLRGAVEDLNMEWEASRKIDAPRYLRSLRQEMSGGNFNGAGLQSFRQQVSSVTFERPDGQPGIDVFFENKQFPAVLPGRVKDINFEPGYGNYVVVESIDPETRQPVDVLYAHLASRPGLRVGARVAPGQIIGRQGGTGNVRSADGTIASIDFFAPAPAGSTSMTPYRNYDRLRRRIAAQLGK